jgi:glutamate synthase (NADPH/NADH) small chain
MSEPAAQPEERWWEREAGEQESDRLDRLADGFLTRCRGEGPANCVARCPLHIDARGYVQLTRRGLYREALQLVREKLPFPGILGYVCSHPCELHCKRIDEDSSIRIRDIKRFLAEWEPGDPQHLLDCEPRKPETVAVVGAGPAGLIAAHDLVRAGYGVTLFEREREIGGCLVHKIPEWRLPRRVVDRDLSVISALGIDVRAGTSVGEEPPVQDLLRDYGAVLLMTGYADGTRMLRDGKLGLSPTTRDTVFADAVTCETGVPGLFAAGDAVSGPATVIRSLAHGRRAAESARRFLSGEDLLEGRESPLPPRPLWTLEIDEGERQRRQRAPVMLEPFNAGLTEEEARNEAGRCLDCECGLCVQDCEFLAKYCRSPKDLARRLKNDGLDEEGLQVVYSCNVCTLCATVCPENLDTGALMLEARRRAVEAGKGPLPAHKGPVGYYKAGVSGLFSLIMPEPGSKRSKRLFFTGCALPAVAPAHTVTVYDELRKHYPGTGVLMSCCGAPVELLGMDQDLEACGLKLRRMMESVGADELVAACPDCTHTLLELLPDVKISTVWELLAGTWEVPRKREGAAVSIHDSCKTRHRTELHTAIRTLVKDGGGRVEDVDYSGELARCCGLGGMIFDVDPDLSQRISRRRSEESAVPMVTYCAGCRMALFGCGKESIHILDYLLSDDWREASTVKPPGSLARYVNRLKTKWAFRRLRPLRTGR